MAAIHGDDIIAEGEPEKLNRLDEVLKQMVTVKVLDRIGPGQVEHGWYLKRHIVYIEGKGFEWLEDPKQRASIIRNPSEIGAKPQSSQGSKDLRKSDPGNSRKLCNLRLAKLARHLVGTQKLTLRFDHQEYGDIVTIPIDSDWAGSEERYSTHARLQFHGGHLVNSWVASDRLRALSSEEAEVHGIVDGSPRGIFTKHMHEEMGRTINTNVETDSTAATGMCSRTGIGKTRHIQV